MKVNNFQRYQKGLVLSDVFISVEGSCACGCGEKLAKNKKKWASSQCNFNAYIQFSILKGNSSIIRSELFKRDQGFCQCCGLLDEQWQADHITEVRQGGGFSNLSNFQTLCMQCHKEKTYMVGHKTRISEQAASTSSFLLFLD
jgi:hypothetical protein